MKNYPTHLSRIQVRKGSRKKVDALIEYIKVNFPFYEDEAGQKGYWWNAVFYQETEPNDILWIVSKSPDWEIIKGDAEIRTTPFRAYYNKFREECWLYDKIPPEDRFFSIKAPSWNLPATIPPCKNYPSRLSWVPLRKGSRARVDDLLDYMITNASLYEEEVRQANYWWDSVFYEEKDNCDLLVGVDKSPDWSKIKLHKDLKPTAFIDYYNAFKRDCWLKEKMEPGDWLDSIWEPEWNLP